MALALKIAAIAVGGIAGLVLTYGFGARWYIALLGGIVFYIAAALLIGLLVRNVWSKQDANRSAR
jgi:hypothetical protein